MNHLVSRVYSVVRACLTNVQTFTNLVPLLPLVPHGVEYHEEEGGDTGPCAKDRPHAPDALHIGLSCENPK